MNSRQRRKQKRSGVLPKAKRVEQERQELLKQQAALAAKEQS